ncbi:MAG: CinA family protein [Actinomyces sp.]|uniref:CinA family protein n=1 Tax=Actinomyces sp. TaxID=29317 RepID=UPI0026DBBD4F|nr:CinA family protein [Actinomyces sp.]MDO4243352.1 CinA family protein [Actinomyces sp.]
MSAAGTGAARDGRAGQDDGVGTQAQAARFLLSTAQERGLTIAVAESLTGGQVASTLVGVPGASAVVVGAVVAYATRIKGELLGVDPERLETVGPVDAEVASQMARGVAHLMGADIGLATTGVAGPGAADGHKPGTAHIAVFSPWGMIGRELHLPGDREQVRRGATVAVLALAVALIDAAGGDPVQDEGGPLGQSLG